MCLRARAEAKQRHRNWEIKEEVKEMRKDILRVCTDVLFDSEAFDQR